MNTPLVPLGGFLVLLASCGTAATAQQPPSFEVLGQQYAADMRPLMQQYCLDCHSTADQEGELDLERFTTVDDARRDTKVWQKVAEMLDNGEMPPDDAEQPTDQQRQQLRHWVENFLNAEALASAGDPGPVVLRRLSNAEYTYTVQDLSGARLEPAREFPVDSAAGEGFTNTGNALVMSPALLTKYFDAGKGIARHAVLLPHGFRFSPSATPGDWTNESLAKIRDFYSRFADTGGGMQVNLQGIIFDTNDGGRLPMEKYLLATIAEREALSSGSKSLQTVAGEHGLNAKYLGILWNALNDQHSSLLLDTIRAKWRTATADDLQALTNEISQWQRALFRFTSVGHIGKVGGPTAWQEPVIPLTARQELVLEVLETPPSDNSSAVTVYLVVSDAADGNENDYVILERPRLVAAGRQDLLLRDVRSVSSSLLAQRQNIFSTVAQCLRAAAQVHEDMAEPDIDQLATQYQVEPIVLHAWLDYLGIGTASAVQIDSHFSEQITSSAGYEFVKGWGSHNTPLLVANSSDQHVRIPGNMKPHGVAVHPAPELQVAVGWRSPVAEHVRVSAKVQHAHPECGNGVAWSLELRRGNTRQRLATGIAHGDKVNEIGPFADVAVRPGDLLSLLIGPRDANHSCDLTAVDLEIAGDERRWDLAADISPDVLAGNPHADQYGHRDVWHFYTEPVSGSKAFVIPADSLLAKWQAATSVQEKEQLAQAIQTLLMSGAPADRESPDAHLYHQLASLGGPLLSAARNALQLTAATTESTESEWGLDPNLFGHSSGENIADTDLCVQAPAVIEIQLPAGLVEDAQFVATARLDNQAGREGSVQIRLLQHKPEQDAALLPSPVHESNANGPWTSNNRQVSHSHPILVNENSQAQQRILAAFDEFRQLFPPALCYTKIVPVDEVVTLTLYYREDEHLQRLMLDESQVAELNRLWEELHFVSQDALRLVDAFQQLLEYATQDADPKVFEPMREPINQRAAAFRQALLDAEPKHVDALLEFAAQAYRRPLTGAETDQLRSLYQTLRTEGLNHEEAFRFTLARVFIAPAFLYRLENAPAGIKPGPVNDWELASRMSYFLWSSQPDAELRAAAAAGQLRDAEMLKHQARRMLNDDRVRRLATEFACQWLHIYDFDELDEKSERHFPEFAALRSDMYEESILYFTDLFQNDGSILELLNADHTFVNDRLAAFYGIPGIEGPEWRRVDGVTHYGRGGILALSATLAKQSGASRTSPILRGNWLTEVLLGEKLPKPPKNVPQLPEDETATEGLTVRQLVEKHTSDPSCASCHQRIDPYGFALESFDAIGRRRAMDLANRPIDTRTQLPDGTQVEGLDGLRAYLLTTRREAIVRQFCRKLLGYALGRGLQLSDEPLLDQMQRRLAENDYRFSVAVEVIIESRQFQDIRGRDTQLADSP